MRVRRLLSRSSWLLRVLSLAAAVAVVYPMEALAAPAASVPAITSATISAPASVAMGRSVDLGGRLTLAGRPLTGRPVLFQTRSTAAEDWQTIGSTRTGFGGWATWHLSSLTAPEQFSVYYAGVRGVAAARSDSATVHVIDLAATAPQRVRSGHPARLAARLTMDGQGLASQPVRFMFRRAAHHAWQTRRLGVANSAGWARIVRRFHSSFQVGMRFEGGPGLAPSRLQVVRVTVVHPTQPRPSAKGFVFPFRDPAQATSSGAWTQDQGVDLAANGYACGSSAVLVAIGDGVVIQKGISGFGPTAPVLRMTSGPFAGRNVYYGHTGRVFVGVGDHVQAGQKLAEIGCGSVGYSQAPHLEIGVGERGGPPCCPAMHATSGEMWHWLVASR